jgi:hypothetical protein
LKTDRGWPYWDTDDEIRNCSDAWGVKGIVGPPERLAPNRARFLIPW